MRLVWALMCGLLGVGAGAQARTPIEGNWVYVSGLSWRPVEVPLGSEKQRGTPATIAIFYPDGAYVEVVATLLTPGKHMHVRFSASDGLLMRVGTWSRTDDRVIRIASREVFHDDKIEPRVRCSLTASGKDCVPTRPMPAGPLVTETCGFVVGDAAHFASEVRCRRYALSPLGIDLSLADLETLAADVMPAK